MATDSLNIAQLENKLSLTLTDLLAIADANGLAYNITTEQLSNFLDTVASSGYVSGLSISEALTMTEDGFYIAEETGDYVFPSGASPSQITTNLSNGLTFIIKNGVNYSQAVIPITVPTADDGDNLESSSDIFTGNQIYTQIPKEITGKLQRGLVSSISKDSKLIVDTTNKTFSIEGTLWVNTTHYFTAVSTHTDVAWINAGSKSANELWHIIFDETNGNVSFIHFSDFASYTDEKYYLIGTITGKQINFDWTAEVDGVPFYNSIQTVESQKVLLSNITPTWNDGYYINTTGATVEQASYSFSDFIEIDNTWSSQISGLFTGTGFLNISFWTDKKVFISGNEISTTVTLTDVIYSTPATAKYIIITLRSADKSLFKLAYKDANILTRVLNLNENNSYNDISNAVNFYKQAYMTVDGNEILSAGWRISDYINVNENKKYYISVKNIAGTYAVATYYDKFGARLGSLDHSGSETFLNRVELTFPSNTHTMVFCSNTQTYSDFVLEVDIDTSNEIVASNNLKNEFSVPKTLYAVATRQFNLFLDNISKNDDGRITYYSSSSLQRRGRKLTFTPPSVIGDISLKLRKESKDLSLMYEQTTLIKTLSNSNGTGQTRYVCMMGDSKTDNRRRATKVFELLNDDGDFDIVEVGTKQGSVGEVPPSGALHEGRSSWTWDNYINDETAFNDTNAFLYSGILDFDQYCTDLGIPRIDVMCINLGTNDVTQGLKKNTPTEIATIIANAKVFIDALILQQPDCKIIIGLQDFGCPEFVSPTQNAEYFRHSISMLNDAYISEFDDFAYNANVYVGQGAYTIDRINSFPQTVEAVADFGTQTQTVYTNNVHPETQGYYQLAMADYCAIRQTLTDLI